MYLVHNTLLDRPNTKRVNDFRLSALDNNADNIETCINMLKNTLLFFIFVLDFMR
jgi:hypothetical protein